MQSLETIKQKIAEKHPELRNDPNFNSASTFDQLQQALTNNGVSAEVGVHVPTEEEMRQLLEDYFVGMIRFFFNIQKTQAEVIDTDSYDPTLWAIISTNFGNRTIWEYILKTYPRYISMIYNYLNR